MALSLRWTHKVRHRLTRTKGIKEEIHATHEFRAEKRKKKLVIQNVIIENVSSGENVMSLEILEIKIF